jgi:uncharacterized protein with PQ loop repeat
MHFLGLKHKHERQQKRTLRKPSRYIVILDKVTLVIGVIGPFVVVPQIWSIYTTQSATGVSLSTWLLMFIVTLPWIFYGIAHKAKSVVVSFTLWEVANLTVVIGVLLYG